MAERKFASIQLAGDRDSGFKFVGLADDGTAWVSNVDYVEAGQRMKLPVPSGWVQVAPLPESKI